MCDVYIEKILTQALKKEDIVLADNLHFHKSEITKQLMDKIGTSYKSTAFPGRKDSDQLSPGKGNCFRVGCDNSKRCERMV